MSRNSTHGGFILVPMAEYGHPATIATIGRPPIHKPGPMRTRAVDRKKIKAARKARLRSNRK